MALITKGMKSNYRGKFCKVSLGKKYPRGSHHYNTVHVLQKLVEESLVSLALFFLSPCQRYKAQPDDQAPSLSCF